MPAHALRRFTTALLALLLTFFIVTPPQAQADFNSTIDTIAGYIDRINEISHNALPFSGGDLIGAKDMINTCDSSSSADDVAQCVDDFVNSPEYKNTIGDSDSLSYLPEMIHVYFDIEGSDWWGLLEDAGEVVACAAAQFITGGIDVCGIAAAIVAAAKEVVQDVEAVVNFLSDIGSDIAGGVKAAYCYVFGCDSSAPPPPSAAAVAYGNFYSTKFAEGLSARLNGDAPWKTYYGPAFGPPYPTVIAEGKAAGYADDALKGSQSQFGDAVYAQWDAAVEALEPKARAYAEGWITQAHAQQYAASGMAAWQPAMGTDLNWYTALKPLLAAGDNACMLNIGVNGGSTVDTWVADGRAPAGYKWDKTSGFCAKFDKQLQTALVPLIVQKQLPVMTKTCPATGATYECVDSVYVPLCKALLAFGGLAGTCADDSKVTVYPYQCPNGIHSYPVNNHPYDCTPVKLPSAGGSGTGGPGGNR